MNARIGKFLVLIVLVAGIGPAAVACLWDADTRLMEERRFPGTRELITGNFLRHSHDFYEWRIEQRLKEIEEDPDDLTLYDDLAVAYEKTGDTAKAIEITEELLQRDRDRYETLANLGTFYIHNGELERGIEFIDKALEVNPDAHFGRERYQTYVAQYVLSQKEGEELTLPLDRSERGAGDGPVGFTEFLLARVPHEHQVEKNVEVERAVKGVAGMMRFGNYDSPVLLECLGDLLIYGRRNDLNLQLAARAYLKASYEANNDEAAEQYRQFAESSMSLMSAGKSGRQIELADLEKQFKREIESAESWVQEVFADEQRWIAEGVDVEQQYKEKYYDAPGPAADGLAGAEEAELEESSLHSNTVFWIVVVILLALFLLWAMSHQVAKINQAKDESQAQ